MSSVPATLPGVRFPRQDRMSTGRSTPIDKVGGVTGGLRRDADDRCKATGISDPSAGAVQVLFMGDAEFGKYAPIDSPVVRASPQVGDHLPASRMPMKRHANNTTQSADERPQDQATETKEGPSRLRRFRIPALPSAPGRVKLGIAILLVAGGAGGIAALLWRGPSQTDAEEANAKQEDREASGELLASMKKSPQSRSARPAPIPRRAHPSDTPGGADTDPSPAEEKANENELAGIAREPVDQAAEGPVGGRVAFRPPGSRDDSPPNPIRLTVGTEPASESAGSPSGIEEDQPPQPENNVTMTIDTSPTNTMPTGGVTPANDDTGHASHSHTHNTHNRVTPTDQQPGGLPNVTPTQPAAGPNRVTPTEGTEGTEGRTENRVTPTGMPSPSRADVATDRTGPHSGAVSTGRDGASAPGEATARPSSGFAPPSPSFGAPASPSPAFAPPTHLEGRSAGRNPTPPASLDAPPASLRTPSTPGTVPDPPTGPVPADSGSIAPGPVPSPASSTLPGADPGRLGPVPGKPGPVLDSRSSRRGPSSTPSSGGTYPGSAASLPGTAAGAGAGGVGRSVPSSADRGVGFRATGASPASLTDRPGDAPPRSFAPSAPPGIRPAGGSLGAPMSGVPARIDRSAELPAARLASASDVPGSRELEGVQMPAITIHKVAPGEVQVNRPATLRTIVRNTGQATVDGVMVLDRVPRGTRLVHTNPPAEQRPDGTLMWKLESLQPGQQAAIEMEVVPQQEGEIGSVARVLFSSAASARTVCTRPELKLVLSAPKQILIGQRVTIDITVSNVGSGPVDDVVLLEDVPEQLSHEAGRKLEYGIGRLQPGETRRISLSLNAVRPGTAVNRMTVRGAGDLTDAEELSIDVIAPKLQVGIEGPKRRYLEREASFRVRVANVGTAASRDISLRLHLPKGLKYVQTDTRGRYDPATHTVSWRLEELAPGAAGDAVVKVLPVETGEQLIRLECTAPLEQRPRAEHAVSVEALSELTFRVDDTADPIELGSETTYEIKVRNEGGRPDSRIEVEVAFPPGIEPVEANGATQARLQNGVVVFQPLAELAPGREVKYRIRARGTQAGSHLVKVRVKSDQGGVSVTREEQTRVYTDQ